MLNDQQVLAQEVIELTVCESLALIQMGLVGLNAIVKGDPAASPWIDTIGAGWLEAGTRHHVDGCNCPPKADMEKRIVVSVVDSLAVAVSEQTEQASFDPSEAGHNHCRICGLCTPADLCDGCERMESL